MHVNKKADFGREKKRLFLLSLLSHRDYEYVVVCYLPNTPFIFFFMDMLYFYAIMFNRSIYVDTKTCCVRTYVFMRDPHLC